MRNNSSGDCSLPLAHGIGLMVINSFGALVGTFGNFLVCTAVLYTNPRLRRCSNYLLVSGAPRAREARAWTEPHSYVIYPSQKIW